MFCHITENWRSRPLIVHRTVVKLISHAGTSKGLTIRAELDDSQYETGKTVSDAEMAKLRITRCAFHGEWNYSFTP
jgi:hypothetical protein